MLRIEAIPIGGGQAFVIADGTGTRGPGGKMFINDIQFTFDAVVPRTTYLNGPQTVHVPIATRNYNQSGNMPLEVEYTFVTEGACLKFWSSLQTICPVLADVVLTADGTRAVIPNVNLRPLSGRTLGVVCVRITYPITFGLIAQVGLSGAVPS